MPDYLSEDLYEIIKEDIEDAFENKDKERLLEIREELMGYLQAGDEDEGGPSKTLVKKL